MFCNNCGTKVPDGVNNCPVCGAALPVQPPVAPVQPGAPVNFDMEKTVMADAVAPQAPVAPVVPPVAPAAPVAPVAPVAPAAPVAPVMPAAYAAPQPPQKKKTGMIIGIIVAVIAVAAIVVGVLLATGVIGGKDEEDDEPETTASEQVEDVTKENSEDETEKDIEEKTEAQVETTTDPFAGIGAPTYAGAPTYPYDIVTPTVPEAPTFSQLAPAPTYPYDTNVNSAAEELAVKNAATEFINAMSDVEPVRIKNSMSAYIHAQVESTASDPEVQNALNQMGADTSDVSNLYVFYAIGIFNNLGDVEKIDSVTVTSVSTTFPPSTQADFDALEAMYGSGLTNPPQITDAAYSTVTVSILNTDGTTRAGTVDLMLFKEGGQWKVFGTM